MRAIIVFAMMCLLTGCVITTSQNSAPVDPPFVEPAFWCNAKPFEKIEKGLFYFDILEEADYQKDGSQSLFVNHLMRDVRGFDTLTFSPFPCGDGPCKVIKGRLEDRIFEYHYLGLFEVKQTDWHETENIGVYFENIRKVYHQDNILAYKTTKGFVVKNDFFSLVVTTAQAEQIGRHAIVRMIFTIEDDISDENYTYKHEYMGLRQVRKYELYKATFHGIKILFDPELQVPPTAIFEKVISRKYGSDL